MKTLAAFVLLALVLPPTISNASHCAGHIQLASYNRAWQSAPGLGNCFTDLVNPGATTFQVSLVYQYPPGTPLVCSSSSGTGTLSFAGKTYTLQFRRCSGDSGGYAAFIADAIAIDTATDDWPNNTVSGGDAVVSACHINDCGTAVYHTIR